jgi:four helix bundle protein
MPRAAQRDPGDHSLTGKPDGRRHTMREFHDLKAWQAAYQLALDVYSETKAFPRREMFGLTNQARRAAASVPANIAEGHGRFSDTEMRRFCLIAHGSLCELQTHLLLARDLQLLSPAAWELLEARVMDTKRLLQAFLRKLAEDIAR